MECGTGGGEGRGGCNGSGRKADFLCDAEIDEISG